MAVDFYCPCDCRINLKLQVKTRVLHGTLIYEAFQFSVSLIYPYYHVPKHVRTKGQKTSRRECVSIRRD